MLAVGDILESKDGEFTVTAPMSQGRSDLYRVERDSVEYVLKAGFHDETLTLAGLLMGADPKLPPYLPKFIANATSAGEFGVVFEHLDGFYSLVEVKQHYPDGIDQRDMAWMFRRLLVVLGFAHKAGYIHGAVTPQHVMIHPSAHGLVLIDWTHAEPVPDDGDDELLDIAERYKGWYPPEAFSTDAGPQTDIYMAANLMSWLMGGDALTRTLPDGIDREYRIFLNTLMDLDHKQRPSDAWTVLGHFDSLIERLYGKRKFHPFHIPPQEA